MIRNYLKTALRNLGRSKSFTAINIAGLSVGISVCLIIFIVITYQTSFDHFHSKRERIYRVLTEYHHADAANIFYGQGVPQPMPAALQSQIPQIEKVAPIFLDHDGQVLVMDNAGTRIEKKFKEENGVFITSPSFFEIFDFPLLDGSYQSLSEPNNVLLAKQTAEKYFGDWKNAMGRTIRVNNNFLLKVTGILAPVPANSDFQLKLVVAFGTGFTGKFATSGDWDGTGSSFGCYVLLSPGASPFNVNTQLRALSRRMKSPENKDSHIIQPLSEVHYDTQAGDYSNRTISHQLIRVLWIIASFILLIACVNFINLSTAQAVNRAKEVGVRKVLGSSLLQLKMQFFTETFLVVLFSICLCVVLTAVALPSVSRILDLPLALNAFQNSSLILFLLTVLTLVTLLAGFYPSMVLSRFSPIVALKNKLAVRSAKGVTLRRGLVVFQFVIAQVLIIGTIIIVRQMNYFTTQPLGFDRESIVNIPIPGDSVSISKQDYLKEQLRAIRGIHSVSLGSNTPVEDDNDNWSTFKFNHAIKEADFYAITKFADEQYLPTYRLPLVAGRNLEASDTAREFLVNEMLVRNLGIKNPQDALGKQISLWDAHLNGPIVGVVKDYIDRSFRRDLAPMLMTTFKPEYSQAGIKLETADVAGAMKALEAAWNRTYPDYVFEYKFLDDKVDSFYKQEKQLGQLYQIFAAVAILLSCLGLYGLASFLAAQRTKEVGIRKVLGASVGSIVYLFSREFVYLILIAFAIASPIAWYYMHRWLQDYVYRIDISWWVFGAGAAVTVAIALVSVSFQALRAALSNPVKSLRTE